jgi:glucose uptake protein GlcU
MDYTSYVYIAIALLPFVTWGSIIIALSKKGETKQQSLSRAAEHEPAVEVSIIPYGLIFPLHYSYPSDRRNLG